MKKIILSILVFAIISSAFCVSAKGDIFSQPDSIGANDFSNVLSENTVNFINENNEKLYALTNSKIICVTVPTTNGIDVDQYAQNLYNSWNISSIGDNSSTFLLFVTDDMEYWSIVGDNLKSALTKDYINNIFVNKTELDFSQKKFDNAIKNTYSAVYSWYMSSYNIENIQNQQQKGDEKADKSNEGKGKFFSFFKILIIILLILFVIYLYFKRKMKLYKIELKKREKIQRYRKSKRYSSSNSDYEFYFYDSRDN